MAFSCLVLGFIESTANGRLIQISRQCTPLSSSALTVVSLVQESSDIDNELTFIPPSNNVLSLSSFDDIQQFMNTSNWISLTIFLNFLLTDSNHDPNYLVCSSCTGLVLILTLLAFSCSTFSPKNYAHEKQRIETNSSDGFSRIHSTFTMNASVSD